MKNKINRYWILSTLLFFGVALVFTNLSCSDDKEDKIGNNNSINNKKIDEEKIIAFYDIERESFSLNFSMEVFASNYDSIIKNDYGADVRVEAVQIDDDQPNNPEYHSYLKIKVYNIDGDYLLTDMIELRKFINEENNKIYYAFGPFSTSVIKCLSTKCAEKGCSMIKNFWGVPQDCTACGDPNGECKKEITVSTIPWTEVAKVLIAAIPLLGLL